MKLKFYKEVNAVCESCQCSVKIKLNPLDRIERFFGCDEFLKLCEACNEKQILVECNF